MTRTTLLQGVVSAGALALSTLAVSEAAGPAQSPVTGAGAACAETGMRLTVVPLPPSG